MPQSIKVGVSQSHTLTSTSATLTALAHITAHASKLGVHLLLFPEAYLGGYPRTCNFGAAVGSRDEQGREQFLAYFKDAVDLGDTPRGAGDDWVEKKLPTGQGQDYRGDGTREELERVAASTGVFLVVGLVEKAGGSLYCSAVYVDPGRGCIGKRRKVMPTGTERLIWAQGSPSTLRAVVATINGIRVTLAAAICWENYMVPLRYALYSQNVHIYLAPTADARDTWLALMRTIALEGRCFVLSANQCVREDDLPHWINKKGLAQSTESPHEIGKIAESEGERRESVDTQTESESLRKITRAQPNGTGHQETTDEQKPRRKSIIPVDHDHELHLPFANSPTGKKESTPLPAIDDSAPQSSYVSRGGSCIISPTGSVLSGPLWEEQYTPSDLDSGLLIHTIDLEDCIRGRLDFDAGGSYSRNDAFRLEVQGLDISPPV